MPKYIALVRGVNFAFRDETEFERIGFFTARVVEASAAATAEEAVVDLLRQDTGLQERTVNPGDDPPLLFVEEVVRKRLLPRRRRTGLVLFPEGDEEAEAEARSLAREAAGFR